MCRFEAGLLEASTVSRNVDPPPAMMQVGQVCRFVALPPLSDRIVVLYSKNKEEKSSKAEKAARKSSEKSKAIKTCLVRSARLSGNGFQKSQMDWGGFINWLAQQPTRRCSSVSLIDFHLGWG